MAGIIAHLAKQEAADLDTRLSNATTAVEAARQAIRVAADPRPAALAQLDDTTIAEALHQPVDLTFATIAVVRLQAVSRR
jgi:hypothetical protein